MLHEPVINLNGTEYLTRIGVENEYHIKPCSLYKMVKTKKLRFMKHPTFGMCFMREWLDSYFSEYKEVRRR